MSIFKSKIRAIVLEKIDERIKLAEQQHEERVDTMTQNFQDTVAGLTENLRRDRNKSEELAVKSVLD